MRVWLALLPIVLVVASEDAVFRRQPQPEGVTAQSPVTPQTQQHAPPADSSVATSSGSTSFPCVGGSRVNR